jgi:heat shock protein HslJ/uncharacterized lipoprotein YbaY
MTFRRSALLLAGASAFVWTAACGEPDLNGAQQAVQQAERETVRVRLAYRERIAVGPDAVAEAVLLAVPADGGEPEEIARQTVPLLGAQPPLLVEIVYDLDDVPQGASLVVTGRIEDGARMVWNSPEPAEVGAAGRAGEMMLVRRAVSEDTANGASGGDLYQCQSVQVEADFTDPGLQLTFDGNTYELEPVQAASGARFAMGQGVSRVEFWSRGDNALFRIGEDDDGWEECRRMAPDASMGGIDEAEQYVAMGQEPGWRLILAGSALRLTADYGERTVEAEVTTYDQTPDGDRIRAGEGDEAVEVLISPEQCADIMSGMPYPDTVTVRFDDRELNGCGGDPESLLAGGAWRVTEIGGEAVETEPAPAITFEGNGRMTGRGPCNTFTGGYEMTGEGIVLTGVAATRRACADESLNAVEQRFFAMLDGRAIYQFGEEGEMRVQAGDGEFVAIRD